jgi:hypothetical protein
MHNTTKAILFRVVELTVCMQRPESGIALLLEPRVWLHELAKFGSNLG